MLTHGIMHQKLSTHHVLLLFRCILSWPLFDDIGVEVLSYLPTFAFNLKAPGLT